MNGVIRSLEEPEFTVLGKLQRASRDVLWWICEGRPGNYDRGADIVLHLQFCGGEKILTQAEDTP